ncbi:hypothetical protein CK221_04030 [Mesorhizobium sp. WSM3868]|nr:hypothetical protein CK221_04030 [Mesorhizobium sp. WSM3868]
MPISLPEGEMSGRTEGGGLALASQQILRSRTISALGPSLPPLSAGPYRLRGRHQNLLPGLATAK